VVSDENKKGRYERIRAQLAELIAKTGEPAAHRATAAALLHHKVPGVSWTGFYMLRDGELVVDTYQGPVACLVLERHTGVCWAAIDRLETVLVPDVHAFPGHIACDSRSRSEIVVPVYGPDATPIGVLDVDSHLPDHFDETDRKGYESIIRLLERAWSS
jgi:GAF domain-containing protein